MTDNNMINYEVLGWGKPKWSYQHSEPQVVKVRVSGRGPHGKLSAIVEISNKREVVEGDGRYSPMHGNSSLRADATRTLICTTARELSTAWKMDNPGAFSLYRLNCSEAEVAEAKRQAQSAKEFYERRRSELNGAEERLRKLIEELNSEERGK